MMLAPPRPPTIMLNSAASLEVPSPPTGASPASAGSARGGETTRGPGSYSRVYRSNSCISDGGAAYMVAPMQPSRRPSKAYLLKQKSSGEETVVMLTRVGPPVVGARTFTSRVPTFVSAGVPVRVIREQQAGCLNSLQKVQISHPKPTKLVENPKVSKK